MFRPVALDKEMRPWDTYVSLEATVKNMLTSLRAVGELQNPAIRERHWRQLMNSTKVSLEIAERMFNSFPTQYEPMQIKEQYHYSKDTISH